jgi:hypothetical protein
LKERREGGRKEVMKKDWKGGRKEEPVVPLQRKGGMWQAWQDPQ